MSPLFVPCFSVFPFTADIMTECRTVPLGLPVDLDISIDAAVSSGGTSLEGKSLSSKARSENDKKLRRCKPAPSLTRMDLWTRDLSLVVTESYPRN